MNLFRKLFSIYYAFSVAMCLFFAQYDFFIPGISIADAMLITSCLPLLITRKYTFKNTGMILFFYFTALVLSWTSITISNVGFTLVPFDKVITRWVRYGIYAVLVFFVSDVCDCTYKNEGLNPILKIYRTFCYLFGAYAIVQCTAYMFMHYTLPLNILPIEWSRTTDVESVEMLAEQNYLRVYGCFQEPSYLSRFLLPGLAYSLFGWPRSKSEKSEWTLALLIFGAIIVSTSIQGIATAMMTLSLYILNTKDRSKRSKVIAIAVISFVCVICVFPTIISGPLERVRLIFLGESSENSSDIRLFRGFSFWWQLPFVLKIIGVGLGNMANYADYFSIYTSYDNYIRSAKNLDYCNGFAWTLVSSGLIGITIVIRWLIRTMGQLTILNKIIFVQFILISLSEPVFLAVPMVFYCALVFLDNENR